MFKVFIVWVTIQLGIIGMALTEMSNQIVAKTYDCKKETTVPVVFGAIFPLVYFVNDDVTVRYCVKSASAIQTCQQK